MRHGIAEASPEKEQIVMTITAIRGSLDPERIQRTAEPKAA